uniref:Dipeptidyl peptidase 9-like n=1 Tax=Crassostrea virginica TaxID=6565 RepID=A0A8B8C4Q5_CRAVI|nr:dipeptidyl peptidase 9-like [Crassostrea virginica]
MATEIPPDLSEVVTPGSSGQISSFCPQSWRMLHQNVIERRKLITMLASRVPSMFQFRTQITPNGEKTRLYFLGMTSKGRENTLQYVDLPTVVPDIPGILSQCSLLDAFPVGIPLAQLSREEQLLRERKRLGSYGITSYELREGEGKFVFPAANFLFTCVDPDLSTTESVYPSNIETSLEGARLDPQICPSNSQLLAFVNQNDIWVTSLTSGQECRLTFTNKGSGSLEKEPLSAGVPSFVVQEEFDRYTGYWWCPTPLATDLHLDSPEDDISSSSSTSSSSYCILYEEVDESMVEILNIFSPSVEGKNVDQYRYPRAGTPNARSTLKLVKFTVDDSGKFERVQHYQLYEPLLTFFPWLEYIVRAGWTPDGKHVYAELLDRPQKRLSVVLIPFDFFVPIRNSHPTSSSSSSYEEEEAMEEEEDFFKKTSPPLSVIYEESSDIWVNTHDILYFLPHSDASEVKFLWASEKSGFRHLYCVVSKLESCDKKLCAMDLLEENQGGLYKANVIKEDTLTSGEWEVNGKQIWVDENKEIVYFIGLKDNVLETHLYAVSYSTPSDCKRLTTLGYSHSVSMSSDCSSFVSVYSSVNETTSCVAYKILQVSNGPIRTHHDINLPIRVKPWGIIMSPIACPDYHAPVLFQYPSSSGFTHHGLFFYPHGQEAGKKYPTVVMVYGGPQVQQVTNCFKGIRFLRHHALAANGYAVVVIDGRGSCGRGLKFESHIKDKLGTVEIEDQVEGLQYLSSKGYCVDMSRVGIHGWSYGGYLSLLGIAQRPDIFKVGIAGAPVVNWLLYDTGYTERYLNVPSENEAGYRNGSVLSHVDKFPDEENRILIIHGLIDENVHFHHTSALIAALVKACKPYRLQIYPNERHGIRNHEASEHYKTMILSFLQNHL